MEDIRVNRADRKVQRRGKRDEEEKQKRLEQKKEKRKGLERDYLNLLSLHKLTRPARAEGSKFF